MKLNLIDLFKKITWAKNGDLTDFSQTNYEAGWAHLGDDTPTVQDFNYVQQMNDKKDQWLFNQLKAVLDQAGIEATENNITALRDAILALSKGYSQPKGLNAETLNFIDETGHTHEIAKASLIQSGIVQLTSNTNSESETLALTAKAGKWLAEQIKADATAFTALHDLFIGVPLPYPLATVPAGCLAMNGQRFDKNRYPKLGQKYPSGVLPDMRGEFPRGWDNGRGVDAGRGLLSAQMDSLQNHRHYLPTNGGGSTETDIQIVIRDNYSNDLNSAPDGAWGYFKGGHNSNIGKGDVKTYLASSYNPNIRTSDETRPRNIAFHYICLAV